ncbi:metal ion transporter metal ion transporter [Phlyctema vagabunda]|uniref:Metal ion transporter metal ion transporter n=1 Tax=Phlyctema vagabunda TaxID=108571 RepID=A0ABR4PMD8_9HELO
MNCPSRTDEPEGTGKNQQPNALAADLTTRQDLNGLANARLLRREMNIDGIDDATVLETRAGTMPREESLEKGRRAVPEYGHHVPPSTPTSTAMGANATELTAQEGGRGRGGGGNGPQIPTGWLMKMRKTMLTFFKFVGPGFMIAVAYIDPGNYSTDVAAGATYKFRLLFVILMSNIFAIFLQTLCIKLGSISGLNLAEACKEFSPWWLNIFLYILAEGAIIATDIAEVIGTAIAINLLIPQIPLVAGCALSIVDVFLILLFYPSDHSKMKRLRPFEFFVMALVLGVVICFCIQLSLIKDTSVREVFKGYLPSSAIIESEGLYQACGILGATVMPHSLYLGSGIVQPRLMEYDIKAGLHTPTEPSTSYEKNPYYPSLRAINFCLKYSIVELALSLFTFALFVNSAILIVAGASLHGSTAADADLFGIHDLLASSLAPAAGTIFALALLLSGISAGIVCTIAGQMVSEGALNWTLTPWIRRLITRSISITPSIIIAGAVGRPGLTAALNGSQVALSIVLPFVTAPLIYFTCRNKYMTVHVNSHGGGVGGAGSADGEEQMSTEGQVQGAKMRNHWITCTFAVLIWLVMAAMNVANLVLLGRGE